MGGKLNTGPLLATTGLSSCIGTSAPGSVCHCIELISLKMVSSVTSVT